MPNHYALHLPYIEVNNIRYYQAVTHLGTKEVQLCLTGGIAYAANIYTEVETDAIRIVVDENE